MSEEYEIAPNNKVRQLREKARYDHDTVNAILDAGELAQVAFVIDGQAAITPMIYGRSGQTLYLHGARKARVIRMLEQNASLAVNVTLLDALVYARSAFNSSMNYRSTTVYGTPRLIEENEAKIEAMRIISEHIMPGRWAELRAPLEKEVKMTGVIAIDIQSAAAKVSDSMPDDEVEDYKLPVWAGLVPLQLRRQAPISDPKLAPEINVSPSVLAISDT
ncbi:MAG: pyridoxamine 5'-phosphate oxidase family protein [Pseudomonadota bacterium]